VGVRLFKNGQWKLIITDETFPIKANVFSYAGAEKSLYRGDFRQRDMRGKKRLAAPAFCTSGTRNELWPMYLEKAYARYFGSYSAIVGGLVHTALVDLTGQTGFCVDMRSEEAKTDIRSGALFKRILGYHNAGYLMGCGSNSGSDSNTSAQGIVQGHAYSILNIVEASDQHGTHQLIRARNPWGSSEWKGKFSDMDKPSWTKRLRTKLNYDPDNEDADDGAFWIGFRDFVTQFRNVYVLRRFKDIKEDPVNGWYKYTNHGEWKGEQGQRAKAWYAANAAGKQQLEASSLATYAAQRQPEHEGEVRVGDAMIQLANNYEAQVFNGDVGRVSRTWRQGRSHLFTVDYESRSIGGAEGGVSVQYSQSSLGKDVGLAYALTVHKAQGSEYPVVVMPVLPQHHVMLYRNLLYTGFSRARKLLVLVGSEAAIAQAVANDATSQRVTLLAERIDNRDFAPPTTRHMSDD